MPPRKTSRTRTQRSTSEQRGSTRDFSRLPISFQVRLSGAPRAQTIVAVTAAMRCRLLVRNIHAEHLERRHRLMVLRDALRNRRAGAKLSLAFEPARTDRHAAASGDRSKSTKALSFVPLFCDRVVVRTRPPPPLSARPPSTRRLCDEWLRRRRPDPEPLARSSPVPIMISPSHQSVAIEVWCEFQSTR